MTHTNEPMCISCDSRRNCGVEGLWTQPDDNLVRDVATNQAQPGVVRSSSATPSIGRQIEAAFGTAANKVDSKLTAALDPKKVPRPSGLREQSNSTKTMVNQ